MLIEARLIFHLMWKSQYFHRQSLLTLKIRQDSVDSTSGPMWIVRVYHNVLAVSFGSIKTTLIEARMLINSQPWLKIYLKT